MKALDDFPLVMTTRQVADATGLSPRRIVRLMQHGKFPRPDDSGNGHNWYRWRRPKIERWLETGRLR